MARTALVTGSSGGIGSAIAKHLASEGYNIGLNYIESENRADDLAQYIHNETSANSQLIRGDVSNQESAKKIVKRCVSEYGNLNVVVNSAGITRDALLANAEPEDIRNVIEVNLVGAMLISKSAFTHLTEAKSARVINISSIVASTGNVGQTAYAASKAGLEGFTRSLAIEFKGTDTTANAIAPGFVDTQMLSNIPDDILDDIERQTTSGELADPYEVASLVEYLASPEASYVNGSIIDVNGGHRLGVM